MKKETLKFNSEEKTMAFLACLPGISILIYFLEEDEYIKYLAAQYSTFLIAIPFIIPIIFVVFIMAIIPCVGIIFVLFGILLAIAVSIAFITAIIYGFIKTSQEEMVHLPVISDIALSISEKL